MKFTFTLMSLKINCELCYTLNFIAVLIIRNIVICFACDFVSMTTKDCIYIIVIKLFISRVRSVMGYKKYGWTIFFLFKLFCYRIDFFNIWWKIIIFNHIWGDRAFYFAYFSNNTDFVSTFFNHCIWIEPIYFFIVAFVIYVIW